MKSKTILITALFLLLIGSATAQTRSSTNLQTTLLTTDPIPLQSGEHADVSFKITNRGDTAAEDVEVTIPDKYPFKLKPDRKRTYVLGTVHPGESYYISTEVIVAENASDGSNDFHVEISQRRITVEEKLALEVQSQDIELNLANLKTTPSTLMPDTEDNKMTLDVVNNGEKTAENVVLELDFPGFFEKTSSFSTREALGNIPPGDIRKAVFDFDINETSPTGLITVPTTIEYSEDDSTAKITKDEEFQIYLSGKPQFKITGVESDLSTGGTDKLLVTVKNIGKEKSTATRIRVLDSSDLPFSYESSSEFIGTLKPGAEGSAAFEISTDKDAEAKDYLIDFEVRGVKDDSVFTEDKTLDIGVTDGETVSMLRNIILTVIALAALITGFMYRERLREMLGA